MAKLSTARAFPGAHEGGLSKREYMATQIAAALAATMPPHVVNLLGQGVPPTGFESVLADRDRMLQASVDLADRLLQLLGDPSPADEVPLGAPPWDAEPSSNGEPESGVDLGHDDGEGGL